MKRAPAPTLHPLVRVLFVLAALAAVALLSVPAASAAPSCGRQVIDDWWDGRIDGTYPLHCYDDAIENLPRDVRDYSSAEDDIKRALQAAMRGKPAPPNKDGSPADSPPPADTTSTSTETTATPPVTEEPPAGPDASPPLGESAGSVPVPLLVLGGLALLLVAGGSAGYLVRRFQSRRLPPPAV